MLGDAYTYNADTKYVWIESAKTFCCQGNANLHILYMCLIFIYQTFRFITAML